MDALDLLGLANGHMAAGEPAQALAAYDRALALRPELAEAHCNRGMALKALGRRSEALAAYDRALALRPELADAHFNRGNLLRLLDQTDEALAAYDRATTLNPGHVTAHLNRGALLRDLRRPGEALISLERAAALRPGLAAAHLNHAVVLHDLGRTAEAVAACDRALALDPSLAEAHLNRGTALKDLKQFEAAIASWDAALALNPATAFVRGEKLLAQLAICRWQTLAADTAALEAAVARGEPAATPFALLLVSDSPALQLQCARQFSAAFPRSAAPPHVRNAAKIKVAFLSADFHDHATTHLAAELFERIDRVRFETIALSFGPRTDDAMQRRMMTAFDRFLDVRDQDDAAVAAMLRGMAVDVAVDLKGYTQDQRAGILARRPAPVQVNYLGYPGTMGADFIDAIIADAETIPPGHEVHYTERVVRLPHSYQPNPSRRPASGSVPTRAAHGLPEQAFVFCCFNAAQKITPAVFDVWMRLLTRVKNSVLWLLHDNDAAVSNLRREATARAVAPERLIFAPRLPPGEHLARHQCADLFLDTLPYNAHTTASDALWAGLPLLTCRGGAFAGRVAAGLLCAVDLPDLVTDTLADYEQLAAELATRPDRLAEMRAKLVAGRATSPLFDAARYTKDFEAVLMTMLEQKGANRR